MIKSKINISTCLCTKIIIRRETVLNRLPPSWKFPYRWHVAIQLIPPSLMSFLNTLKPIEPLGIPGKRVWRTRKLIWWTRKLIWRTRMLITRVMGSRVLGPLDGSMIRPKKRKAIDIPLCWRLHRLYKQPGEWLPTRLIYIKKWCYNKKKSTKLLCFKVI